MWAIINNSTAIIWVDGTPVRPGQMIQVAIVPEGVRKLAQVNPNIRVVSTSELRVIRRPIRPAVYRTGRGITTRLESVGIQVEESPEVYDLQRILREKTMAELRKILKNLGGSSKRTDKKQDLINKILELIE